jgi:TetR/AcrR family tetracycline transcriptional repressor
VTPATKTPARERLSRDAIVAGAIELADREGIDAVTIRRLASDHSVTPMALYWHFTDKDAVFDGIAERIYGAVEVPSAGEAAWEVELRSVLDALLAAIRPHPLIADLLAPRIMKSEPGLLLSERVIGLLRAGGFSPARASQTAMFLLCSIVILVTSQPDNKAVLGGQDRDSMMRTKRAQLDSLDPQRFPSLLESAEFFVSCDDEEEYYSQGLDFLVAGALGTRPA